MGVILLSMVFFLGKHLFLNFNWNNLFYSSSSVFHIVISNSIGFLSRNGHAMELAPLDYIPREILSYFRVSNLLFNHNSLIRIFNLHFDCTYDLFHYHFFNLIFSPKILMNLNIQEWYQGNGVRRVLNLT